MLNTLSNSRAGHANAVRCNVIVPGFRANGMAGRGISLRSNSSNSKRVIFKPGKLAVLAVLNSIPRQNTTVIGGTDLRILTKKHAQSDAVDDKRFLGKKGSLIKVRLQ